MERDGGFVEVAPAVFVELAGLLDRAEAAGAECSQGRWFWNSYSGVFEDGLTAEWDPWCTERVGHSLERRERCEECRKSSCDLAREAYDRDPLVAGVPSDYGDTATGRHAAEARHIAMWSPQVVALLIARDRALLDEHAHAVAGYEDPSTMLSTEILAPRNMRRITLAHLVQEATVFWRRVLGGA